MPFVYVLRSFATGQRYTGATADLASRLNQHNANESKSTKGRGPWELIYHEEFSTLGEALRRERYFKSGKGREELKRILDRLRADGGGNAVS
jgi:putative endonuclease